ncbi:MAG: hypothetical protein SCARUB_02815 [Candidatus Scalindua rubra]|uniref:Uncharacterized protein n=1 Tax=Candidatus Scalindua rubra TaxID=1872076 RepID=A0A1E3X8X7_9BACT|nr:MAG: hypothetical protein SCARUB_02815 [Candidatus Scalindua rubra]
MEEAPFELKSIVDFLNRQMERSEVLIVEAKQYEHNGMRVIVPSLFGYTEEARRIKKNITVNTDDRRKWNEQFFLDEIKSKLEPSEWQAIWKLYEFCVSRGCIIKWGTGKQTGSYSIVIPNLFQKSIISVFSNGKLTLNFGWLEGHEIIEHFRDDLAHKIRETLNVSIPEHLSRKYPSLSISEWSPKCDILIAIMEALFKKYMEIKS